MSQQFFEIIIDDRELKTYLEKLSSNVSNLAPLLEKLGNSVNDAINTNFVKEGRPSWTPLKSSTLKDRKKKGFSPGPILQRTGSLKNSVTRALGSNYVTIGRDKEYAAIQNFGGMAGRNRSAKIPARPFINLTNEDINNLENTVVKYLDV